MFAIRDQENIVHGHQTAAAAKPLNQGSKAIGPKTPGPGKIAFGGNLTTRKPIKDDENTIFNGTKKGGNLDKQAFITPLAPRDRAPLGAKTTNAKGQIFKTPAPGFQKTQKRTTSARKTKLKIHQPDAVVAEPSHKTLPHGDNVLDVEYCPPKITPLPDLPDDPYIFTDDFKSPFFGTNVFPEDDSFDDDNYVQVRQAANLARRQREAREAEEQYCEKRDAEYTLQAHNLIWGTNAAETRREGTSSRRTMDKRQVHSSSLDAKTAASALASRPVIRNLPHFAAPTAATRAKTSSTNALPRSPVSAASHATIGYSAGRKVSASLKPNSVPIKRQASRKLDVKPSLAKDASEGVKGHRRTESEILRELLQSDGNTSFQDGVNEDSDLFEDIAQIRMPWDLEDGKTFQLEIGE